LVPAAGIGMLLPMFLMRAVVLPIHLEVSAWGGPC